MRITTRIITAAAFLIGTTIMVACGNGNNCPSGSSQSPYGCLATAGCPANYGFYPSTNRCMALDGSGNTTAYTGTGSCANYTCTQQGWMPSTMTNNLPAIATDANGNCPASTAGAYGGAYGGYGTTGVAQPCPSGVNGQVGGTIIPGVTNQIQCQQTAGAVWNSANNTCVSSTTGTLGYGYPGTTTPTYGYGGYGSYGAYGGVNVGGGSQYYPGATMPAGSCPRGGYMIAYGWMRCY